MERVNNVIYNIQRPHNKAGPQTAHVNSLKACHNREAIVNVICCAEGDSQTAASIDWMAECHSDTPLESIVVREELTSAFSAGVMSMLQSPGRYFPTDQV